MQEELRRERKRHLNVSGVFRILGVSRSGYQSFLKRLPSERQLRKKAIMVRIKAIYEESYQNYGAPKITQLLREDGETKNILNEEFNPS